MSYYRGESGYIDMIADVLAKGVEVPDRTGVGCIAMFDAKVVYDVGKVFPFSTIRPAPLRMAFEEFWMFLRGETQTKVLEDKGINFWKPNTSKEFLNSRELGHLPEGDMGKAYGFQFRNFGGESIYPDGQQVSYGGHDQLQEVYEELVENPYSRRLYTTFWNPSQSHEMALTPCWHSHHWVVLPDGEGRNVLNLKLINRSLDSVFGFSFAIQQYALYQIAMANLLGMKVGKLSCDLSHVHIYNNQIEYAEELIRRNFGKAGTVEITKPLHSLNDLVSMQFSDIEVQGLEVNSQPFSTPRPPMAV